ncbi:type II toxin-antitoxin system PemK/MazF family toxin [Pediococcus acidilactici]|uniref:type II toxin-antitoxin system PemK/MazF family toxin n=1 Tax=Pediococcus acidilactici TaxID=1254 RepID=UPI00132B7A99|nr:type II toxin-antitoxin system PemK/MazF family toxin [Pediococcus acidilactici]KAF0387840.1 type II toxin-antitoxin system PemK/MazF family toxin [Pediococcus acidilactici]KAF0428793.1 type II toxin-antitoxin system PemK/MazF family toxin [Pediococcus acidilactici]KAF0445112.1 type II toxin-antitoxin system PemK/MazF family toxin [Pediococcus acidilactici]KAF0553084.1 type II toxin-antitoxin system PemK/MazF family toxin [Pediococcus acidilactici]MCT3039909.1 type II toxin-antitoxin system
MKLSQGDVIWIDLNPAKGTETKKRRPCLVVSNNHYNRYFNTVLVVPISTAEKYRVAEKYVKSPLFIPIDQGDIQGTVLLQHVRAVDPTKRSNGQVMEKISSAEIEQISNNLQQFFN